MQDHMVTIFKVLEEAPYCSLQLLHQFTLPPAIQEVSFPSRRLQHLLFVDFLMLAILTGVICIFVVSICISLVTLSIFSCVLVTCMSSLEKCLLRSAHFLVGCLLLFLAVCLSLLNTHVSVGYNLASLLCYSNGPSFGL